MRFLKTTILLSWLWTALPGFAQSPANSRERTAYFFGEVKMSSPSGQPFGSSVSLVKRTLKPAESKIVEHVLSLDARQPAKEYTTVFDVQGSKFSLKDDEGTFAGAGELDGPAWEWLGWKYSVEMLGERKGTLQGEDTLVNGSLIVKKAFFSPDGRLRVVFSEDLKPLSREMYDILHGKLRAK